MVDGYHGPSRRECDFSAPKISLIFPLKRKLLADSLELKVEVQAMLKQKTFGKVLRDLRVAADKSMGEVARALGISTVYYSEVENEKKPPFPQGKVDFQVLARFLSTNQDELEKAAVSERQKVELVLDKANADKIKMATVLARRLHDDSLTQDQINQINEILGRNKGGSNDVPEG